MYKILLPLFFVISCDAADTSWKKDPYGKFSTDGTSSAEIGKGVIAQSNQFCKQDSLWNKRVECSTVDHSKKFSDSKRKVFHSGLLKKSPASDVIASLSHSQDFAAKGRRTVDDGFDHEEIKKRLSATAQTVYTARRIARTVPEYVAPLGRTRKTASVSHKEHSQEMIRPLKKVKEKTTSLDNLFEHSSARSSYSKSARPVSATHNSQNIVDMIALSNDTQHYTRKEPIVEHNKKRVSPTEIKILGERILKVKEGAIQRENNKPCIRICPAPPNSVTELRAKGIRTSNFH